MEITNDILRKERKNRRICVRAYPSQCAFMKKKNISPTLLFQKALEELISKEKKK